jgi:hypothetical protein
MQIYGGGDKEEHMRRAGWIIWGFVSFIPFAGHVARAGPTNLGFETGDLTGWNFTAGYVSVGTSAHGRGNQLGTSWLPTEGSYFAYLKAGVGTGTYTMLAQDFSLGAGEIVAFDVFFDTGDWMPHHDDGYARLTDLTKGTVTTLYAQSVATVGDFGADGWTRVSYTAPQAGEYRLEFGVRNVTDNLFFSAMGVDSAATVPSPVPAPGALALCLMALGQLGWWRRRGWY